jgi:DNA-binding transcriptional MocR family regulator
MERRIGLTLDPQRAEPLHRQIFDQIALRIQSGAFPGGHRLPPTRELAGEIGAHRNTVVRAYEDLADAGFVTSTVGRGTFVVTSPPAVPLRAVPGGDHLPWRSLLSRAAERPLGALDRLEVAPGSEPADVINLARSEPSLDLLPDELFRRCLDYTLRTLGPRALGVAPREGLHRLRGLIAEDLRRQGVPSSAETILITGGSRQALDLIARTLINPGDGFFVDALTDRVAASIFAAAGAQLVPVPDDGEGPSLAFLKRHGRAGTKGLYVMPNGQDPTALTLSPERRAALVGWSREARVPIIEGDHAADLRLDGGSPAPALRTLDGDVIYVGTFSKRLIPALRIGYLICPSPLRPALAALQQSAFGGAALLLQHALAEFLERGYLRAHLGRVIPAYRERRDALLSGLAANLPRGMRLRRPEHGTHLWLPLPQWLSAERVEAQAKRMGVLVSPSTAFAIGVQERPGLRLSFSAETPERLAEGARRLGKVFAGMIGQPAALPAQVRETA